MTENNNLLFQRIERIVRALDYSSINDFALNGLGYSSSEKISRIKRGGKPSYDILNDISNKFEIINLDWLISGKGEMLKSTYQAAPSINVVNQSNKNCNIKYGAPLYDLPVSAGIDFNIHGSDKSIKGIIEIYGVKCEAYFPIVGSSMEPLVDSGNWIGVNKIDIVNDDPIINPTKIFFIITPDERMIKHIEYQYEDDFITCKSPNYNPFKIPVNDIKALYRVDVIIKFP